MKDESNAQPTPEQPNDTPAPTPVAPSVAAETEQPTQATSTSSQPQTDTTPAPMVIGASPKKSKKKLVIGGIIAGVLVLLLGVSAAAYNLWYQNPDKVLSDAVMNAVKAETAVFSGTIELESNQAGTPLQKSTLTIDGKSTSSTGEATVTWKSDYNGRNIEFSGTGIYDADKNLYVKMNNVRQSIESFGATTEMIPPEYNALINKIDNKWIKITQEDLMQLDESYGESQTCIDKATERLSGNQAAMDELATLYMDNKFVVVAEKLGARDGSLGYLVEGDKDKAKSFVKGLKDTTVFKELKECDDTLELDEDELFEDSGLEVDDGSTTRVELWVDRWSHQFTNMTIIGKSDEANMSASLDMEFDLSVTVEAPTTDVITVDELQAEIQSVFMAPFSEAQPTSMRPAGQINSI